MADGIQIINSSSVVQLDDTYRALLKVASGTGTATGPTPSGFAFPKQTSCAPMVFVRPHSDGTYIGANFIGNDRFTLLSNGTYDWIVYGLDSAEMVAAGAMGFQVFSQSGQVVYDSRYEQLRIQAYTVVVMPWPTYPQGGSYGQWSAYPYTVNFQSFGTRPWLCLNSLSYFGDEDGTTICATTSGLTSVTLQCGCIWSGNNWTFSTNNGSNGFTAKSYPGGRMPFFVAQREIP